MAGFLQYSYHPLHLFGGGKFGLPQDIGETVAVQLQVVGKVGLRHQVSDLFRQLSLGGGKV